jgi:hypothetical protein
MKNTGPSPSRWVQRRDQSCELSGWGRGSGPTGPLLAVDDKADLKTPTTPRNNPTEGLKLNGIAPLSPGVIFSSIKRVRETRGGLERYKWLFGFAFKDD